MKLVKMSIAAVVTALLAGCSGSMVVPVQEHASILSNADQAKQALAQTTSCCKAFNEFNYVSLPEGDTLLTLDGNEGAIHAGAAAVVEIVPQDLLVRLDALHGRGVGVLQS